MQVDDDLVWSAHFWAEQFTIEFRHATYGEIYKLETAQNISIRSDIEEIINGKNITGAGRITGIGYDPLTLSMKTS
ncbi:MAG: hypothetical protein MR935_00405 [Agathobaculum sp.]|uniref:hypothetical protein n=1 Tax=Agathobaculum sp. TaxID=2048138 RepID=UPI0025C2AFFE|nr:hypothetical protein [Agathobaculum sp.]MCI7124654.1 hypothetical protein [Agathobaculum sp.]MDY3712260.1 hypothetical protein [Agathobaculum sp.]